MMTAERLQQQRLVEDRQRRGRQLAYYVQPMAAGPNTGSGYAPAQVGAAPEEILAYWVPSQGGQNEGYIVKLPDTCPCEDHHRRPELRCKHLWAVVYHREALALGEEATRQVRARAYAHLRTYLSLQPNSQFLLTQLELLNPL